MANWDKTKVLPSEINNGNEYNKNDVLSIEALNAIINNGFYSTEFVEGVVAQGEYDGTKAYKAPNIVTYQGSGYMATSLNSFIGVLPTDTSKWVKIFDIGIVNDGTNRYFYNKDKTRRIKLEVNSGGAVAVERLVNGEWRYDLYLDGDNWLGICDTETANDRFLFFGNSGEVTFHNQDGQASLHIDPLGNAYFEQGLYYIEDLREKNVATEINGIKSRANKTENDIAQINTILNQSIVTVSEVEDKYTSRETANGASIYDGVNTNVLSIQGDTVVDTETSTLVTANFKGILSTSENLFDKNTATLDVILNENGENISYVDWFASDFIAVTPSQKINIIGKNNGANNAFFDENKTFQSTISLINGQITVPNNAYYMRINGKIEELETTIVCANADSLSVANDIVLGKWDKAIPSKNKVIRATKVFIFNGTESWLYNANIPAFTIHRGLQDLEPTTDSSVLSPTVCNLYETKTSSEIWSRERGCCIIVSGTVNQLRIHDNNFTDLNAWKAHLAELYANGTPLMVFAKSATPTEETVEFNKSSYTAWAGGSETIIQGSTDNSQYGAENTVTQEYLTQTGGGTDFIPYKSEADDNFNVGNIVDIESATTRVVNATTMKNYVDNVVGSIETALSEV